MSVIKVAELFYSLQGEGFSRGIPAVFMRMPHCNLMCQGKDWKCDSFELRDIYKEYSVPCLWDKVSDLDPNIMKYLKSTRAHMIYTGGEPGMKANARMIQEFRAERPFYTFDEVETNGSVQLNDSYEELMDTVDIVNCSPKLASSGNSVKLRFNKETLAYINDLPHSYFKFVVNDVKDLAELDKKFDFIHDDKIILMPATHNLKGTDEKDNDWQKYVWDFAVSRGWMFSAREHIDVWGMRAGV